MSSSSTVSAPVRSDAELVQACLAGDRDAFRAIVVRYQTLICSLTYSATGNLARSEDLAQETFITAWRKLPDLREPSRLRAWLCGIARVLSRHSQREAAREPAQLAEPLAPAHESPAAAESSPSAQAISREEEALLWRALSDLPALYREPLVLFYREHQSVVDVAAALDLSEDAVKQRLARGRALLQTRVAALVEGTLARSGPGRHFALDVMTALPVASAGLGIAASGKIAATGAASGSGGTGAKSSALAGLLSFWGALAGCFAVLGGAVGYQMADPDRASPAERRWILRFWHGLGLGLATFILPCAVLLLWHRQYPWLRPALSFWLVGFYVLVAVLFGLWMWRHRRRIRDGAHAPSASPSIPAGSRAAAPDDAAADDDAAAPAPAPGAVPVALLPRPRFPTRSVALVTLCMAAFLVFLTPFFHRDASQILPATALGPLLAAHPEAQLTVLEYESGFRSFRVTLPAPDHPKIYRGELTASALPSLQASGHPYHTLYQGRDFELLGWPGRFFFLLAAFLCGAGIIALGRHAWLRSRSRSLAAHAPIPPLDPPLAT